MKSALSTCLIGLAVSLLVSCSITPSTLDATPKLNQQLRDVGLTLALAMIKAETGLTFAPEPFQSSEGDGLEAYSFQAVNGSDVVTINLMKDGSFAYIVSQKTNSRAWRFS